MADNTETEALGGEPLASEEEQGQDQLAEDRSEELEAKDSGTEGDETAESEEGTEEKPKKKGGFQRRIERLEKEKFEAEYQAEQANRKAQEYAQYLQALQTAQGQPQQPGSDMPKLADFDFDEGKYQQAVSAWSQNQLQGYQQSVVEQQRQWAAQHAEQERQMIVAQKVSQGQEKYPDFVSRMYDPSLPSLGQVNPAAFDALVDSDQFHDVAYFLANNPAEIYGFRGLSEAQAIRKIAKIENQLSGGTSLAGKPAPPPPSRLGGNAAGRKDPEKMTADEWQTWRNAQVYGKK